MLTEPFRIHSRSEPSVARPRGDTYTNPRSGLPVKSMGRTARSAANAWTS
jgi:hypothetical protein